MTTRILVVDDDPVQRRLMEAMLKRFGYEPETLDNGDAALKRLESGGIACMILDLVMPEFDGLHALRSILGEDPAAKIVVVSALDQKAILKEAFKLGAADFVVKPFNQDQLVTTLKRVAGVC